MRSVPAVRQVVLKVHSRCNLSCNYCYMYEYVDQRWRDRPRVMSTQTVTWVAKRLGEYIAEEKPAAFTVILHGGEPLLVGPEHMAWIIETIRAEVPADTNLDFTIQSNGVLLDDAFLSLFATHGVRVGISLDGDQSANDRHRLRPDGRSSYDDVERGIARLRQPAYTSLYAGLLATVDVRNDPVATYESLLRHEPPKIDLLLPHGNWNTPPPNIRSTDGVMSYAQWLIAVFDRWYDAPVRETGIRLFESIVLLLLGGSTETRSVGPANASFLTIETDGGIEGDDALKTTAMSVVDTGLTVQTHSLADAIAHPAIAGTTSAPVPAATCMACPVFTVCGGGLPAHRYHPDSGFDNPSVYCEALFAVINHVRTRVEADLVLNR
jgi:uncharacterized protein